MKRSKIVAAQEIVRQRLEEAGIMLAADETIEIADFGLGRFEQKGLSLVVRVNEAEYCSKWLVLLPGQECPTHYHKIKKETFFALQGTVYLWADGEEILLHPGERYTLLPGVRHRFGSIAGAVIEEVSTYDENSDSYFDDPAIVRDPLVEED